MSSALGVALGMDDTYTWEQVVSDLTGVVTKTSGNQSVTTSGQMMAITASPTGGSYEYEYKNTCVVKLS